MVGRRLGALDTEYSSIPTVLPEFFSVVMEDSGRTPQHVWAITTHISTIDYYHLIAYPIVVALFLEPDVGDSTTYYKSHCGGWYYDTNPTPNE